jgi:hypothetical protein
VLRFLFGAAAVLGVGSYAYQVGVAASQARTDQLEADLVRFQRANLDLRDRIASIRQQSTDAEAELQSMRERYSADIASGQAALLLTEIRTQLTAGVDPERLAFLIRAAGLNSACPSAPVTKRFMPRTQVSTGPVSSVRFDERITVAGAGEAARNDSGLPEAWYDPAKPVRLEFRTLDGTATTVERVVPSTIRWSSTARSIASAQSAATRGSSRSRGKSARCRNRATTTRGRACSRPTRASSPSPTRRSRQSWWTDPPRRRYDRHLSTGQPTTTALNWTAVRRAWQWRILSCWKACHTCNPARRS